MIIINAMQCTHCHDIIFSRTKHDMRWCGCGKIAIDGGREYLRGVGTPPDFTDMQLEIEDSILKNLYQDYNRNHDKFGRYSHGELPTGIKIIKKE